MVAYLKKIEGSEGFHQIVDFLNTSHICTLDNGEMEITATIDGKIKIVTEASIRRYLRLEDSDGISNLPTTKFFEQLALMGSPPHTNVVDEVASTGVDVRYGGAATTVTGLEAGQGSDIVVALETDLTQKKKVYGDAFTKLIKKVKRLKKKDKLSNPKDTRKAKMVEPEKPLKKKDQIKFDEELAQRLSAQLQAELEEEERLAKQREEAANIAEWDDV
ncbi:hypothetical protein Tco_0779886 [Tanacetum coccineum]